MVEQLIRNEQVTGSIPAIGSIKYMTLKEDLVDIYKKNRGILSLMILNLLFSIGLFIFSLASLNPESAVVKIGYGDIDGYRDGTWVDMLSFSLLAIVLGVFHNFLAIVIFKKRGKIMAKFFLGISIFLILGAFLVLIRLLGEG